MEIISDQVLLRRLRLCRADLIAGLCAGRMQATATSIREIADLQLAIMATEGAIFDKKNREVLSEYEEKAAA